MVRVAGIGGGGCAREQPRVGPRGQHKRVGIVVITRFSWGRRGRKICGYDRTYASVYAAGDYAAEGAFAYVDLCARVYVCTRAHRDFEWNF
jgi:hypothetical protein